MPSPWSILKQLADVLVILALGLVYVVALSVGTVASQIYRKLDALKGSGANVIRRIRGGPQPKS
ncbi:hypothetical protein [Halosimplex amylolyticum]|uniref:hypothetical protein n=1 Tax=Halosimplex amylolyticum TaxID=3396616 RepID=UPI003F568D5C